MKNPALFLPSVLVCALSGLLSVVCEGPIRGFFVVLMIASIVVAWRVADHFTHDY
jgi:hypothetical protein